MHIYIYTCVYLIHVCSRSMELQYNWFQSLDPSYRLHIYTLGPDLYWGP